jgi:mannose-1-phosphate guanylyltransferase
MRPFIERWLGCQKPKQYCTFVGTRSLFQHTVDRAAWIVPAAQIVAVVAQQHHTEVEGQLKNRPIGTVLFQPENRETAVGMFFALTALRAVGVNAIVVVFPSDHFVYPESAFIDAVQQAVEMSDHLADRLILLGVQPDRLELDYGWMVPGATLSVSHTGVQVRTVSTFLEKPDPAAADAALQAGALWNTFVMVSHVNTFWRLGQTYLPDIVIRFERLAQAIGSSEERHVIEEIYQHMPVKNFSTDLLQQAPEAVAVMELPGVLWCDWGKPQRVAETLRRVKATPAFPLACLDRPFAPISRAANGIMAVADA